MKILIKTSQINIGVNEAFISAAFALILFLILGAKAKANENYLESNNLLAESEKIDPTFAPAIGFAGRIFAAVRQADGKLLVGGVIDNANGVPHSNLARFLENGELDNSFIPPLFNDAVMKLALQSDGKILVLGSFTKINGIARNGFARLNSDGSLDMAFNSGTSSNTVIGTMLVLPDDRILLTGGTIIWRGVTRKGLMRLNSDGSVDPSLTITPGGFETGIGSIAVTSDNKIYVGGAFSQINGFTREKIAKLEWDGTVIQTFNANISSGTIFDIIPLNDGKVLIAGRFSIGSNLIHLARLNADGKIDETFKTDSQIDTWVTKISLHPNGKIFVYGSFGGGSGTERNIFLLNSDGAADESFSFDTVRYQTSIVSALVRDDGKIYLVGEFSKINSAAHYSLFRLNTDYSVDGTFNPYTVRRTLFDGSAISTLVFQPDGKILVGGAFEQVNGKPRKSLARLNPDGSLDVSFNQNDVLYINDTFPPVVSAIALQSDGKILIGGRFTTVAGSQRSNIARLNPDGTVDVSFDFSLNSVLGISSLAVQSDGKILIGGQFPDGAGSFQAPVIRRNPDGSPDLTFNASSAINSGSGKEIIIQPDNKILVSGAGHSSSTSWNSIARLNPDGTRDTTFNTLINDSPDIELQPDGKIFIGGFFTQVNNQPRQRIARLNADGSLDATFTGAGTNQAVFSVAQESNGRYLIGGQFSQAQSKARLGLARFTSSGFIDSKFFEGGTQNGNISKIYARPDGKVIVCGKFHTFNNVPRLGIVQLSITNQSPFDFDGDGRSDISVFRPSNAAWYLNRSTAGFTGVGFGLAADKLTPADYDGDGKTDVAVFRDGYWYITESSTNQFRAVQFGQTGDVPVPADYDGDGKADVAVFRQGNWYFLNSSNNQFRGVQFGISTDKPVQADYDGDGKTDVAVFRDGNWYWSRSSDNAFRAVQFGVASDKPVAGDYDGDGIADQAVFRSGVWYVLGSMQGFYGIQFGVSTDIPVVADYDGDGKADIAVFRDGNWYSLSSSNNQFRALQFGLADDKPIPAAFVPLN
ncbi:MAG TPA: FG-GAP-like repeat-containing protein [Pyrinomonadaceae bacterium]|jgi:uncharacterized delta-60 repeat protein